MKKVLRLFPIILLAALLAVAVFGVALPREIAHAATPAFKIVGKSATEWYLYLSSAGEQTLLKQNQGVFFEPGTQGVTSDLFVTAIHDWLSENGYSSADYHLSFELPEFEAQSHGDGVVDYNAQFDGDFSLSARVSSVMNVVYGTSSMTAALQYRKADSQDYDPRDVHGRAEEVGDPIFFGRVDVGEYWVRYVAYENFTFDHIPYSVARYSKNEFRCTVRQAVAPQPAINSATITYGVAAGDIRIFDATGRWSFDHEQDGIGADSYLEVSDEPHTVYFNYVSNDANYLPREHIPVAVSVTPRLLRVYVGDAHSLKGEPMVDLSKTEHVIGDLVGDDEEADLGLEFYLSPQFEQGRAGTYFIYARITNKNYSCLTVSLRHTSVQGGIYTVYETVFEVTAADGRKFTVYCDTLPQDARLVVETGDAVRVQADIPEGAEDHYYESVAAYRICFYDSLRNRIPADSLSVEWEGEVEGATYMAVFGDAADVTLDGLTPYDGAVNGVMLEGGQDSVAFFKEVTTYPAENVWTWYNIILTALVVVLFAALVVCVAEVLKRRRRTWR